MISQRTSPDARRQLVETGEGLRLKAYRDCVGVWTIGYGHTGMTGGAPVRPGDSVTKAQADDILSDDLRVFEKGVAAAIAGVPDVKQQEFDALVDLAFNIGLNNFRKSTVLRLYKAGLKAKAADAILMWNRAGGKVVPGLVSRRERERSWFLTGRLPRFMGALDYAPAVEEMPRLVDDVEYDELFDTPHIELIDVIWWAGIVALIGIAVFLLTGCVASSALKCVVNSQYCN